jgi:signal transduction histidine kinase
LGVLEGAQTQESALGFVRGFMDTHTISHAPDFSIATVPPTARQRQLSVIVAAIVLAATGVITAFGATQLQEIDSIVPVIEFVIFVSDLFTAALLSSHARIIGSHRLLVLASGYLFSALMVLSHVLTFPGAFAPSGLLGAGLQTTGWLFIFWHLGFPISVIVYACLKDETRTLPRSTIYWSTALVVLFALLLTWFATVHDALLPPLFVDRRHITPLANHATAVDFFVSVLALALLWRRQKSVLDLWLTVALFCMVAELWVNGFVIGGRFSLGFYAARFLSVIVSVIVLFVLLIESTVLYARLSDAIALLQRERNNRLINIKAATSSIVHEVRQPLAAMTASATAARRWLEKVPPDVGEVKPLVENIERAGIRASEVLANVPTLFQDADDERQPVDVSNLALETLKILHGELDDHAVKTNIELASELPPVMGNGVQLREVILNLVRNAIDAMDSNNMDRRTLKLRTKSNGAKAIIMEVEDSGPGIKAERLGDIFEAFVTTKPHGTGLGLAICRRIIERHGGRLTALSDGKNGALFQIVLPVGPMYKAAGPAE